MADGKITYNEVFDPNLQKGIDELKKSTQDLVNNIKELTRITLSNTQAGKEAATNTKTLSENQKKLIQQEKEAEKVRKQLILQQQKLSVEYQKFLFMQKDEIKTAQQLAAIRNAETNSEQKRAAIVSYLTTQKAKLNLETENGRKRLEAYNRSINNLNSSLIKTGSIAQQQQKNIGNYEGRFNNLNNAMSQITREAPAFANSMNTGFMAISNNLPILFDGLQGIREQNKALAAEGKPTVSVLGALAKSFFSWQTLISTGITLLTVFGGRLIELAQKGFKAKNVVDDINTSVMKLSKSIKDAQDDKVDIKSYFGLDENEFTRQSKIIKSIEKDIVSIQQKIGDFGGKLGFDVFAGLNTYEEILRKSEALGLNLTKSQIESLVALKEALIQNQNELLKLTEDKNKKEEELQKQSNIKLLEDERDYYESLNEIQGGYNYNYIHKVHELNNIIIDLKKEFYKWNKFEYEKAINEEMDAYNKALNSYEMLLQSQKAKGQSTNIGEDVNFNSTAGPVDYDIMAARKAAFWDMFVLTEDEKKDIKSGMAEVLDMVQDFTDKQVELAEKRTEAAKTEVEKQRDNLNRQIELRNQGFANNVAFAEKEYQNSLNLQQKAQRNEQKALRNQLIVQSAEQSANMITASTGLLAKAKGNPVVYFPLLALLWGTFLTTKTKAFQATKYAKGGIFDVGGGTHDSGNDTSLGVHGGRDRRAQRGERVAVINDKASRKYGGLVDEIIGNLNGLRISKIAQSRNGVVINMSTNKLERGINTLVEQGREKIYTVNGKTIREYKGLKQRYV